MKKYVNGQYIDLTADEISAIRAAQAQERRRPRTYEEGISAWKAATDAGIIDGTDPHGVVTREMLIQILNRIGLVGNK